MIPKECAACGREYAAKRAASKYCSDTCRKRAQRGVRKAPVATSSSPQSDGPGPLEAAAIAELEEAKRLDTVLGQSALALASRIEAGQDTGAGLASLVKQLQTTIAAAVEGANQDADPVDELRALRDKKRGVAG